MPWLVRRSDSELSVPEGEIHAPSTTMASDGTSPEGTAGARVCRGATGVKAVTRKPTTPTRPIRRATRSTRLVIATLPRPQYDQSGQRPAHFVGGDAPRFIPRLVARSRRRGRCGAEGARGRARSFV